MARLQAALDQEALSTNGSEGQYEDGGGLGYMGDEDLEEDLAGESMEAEEEEEDGDNAEDEEQQDDDMEEEDAGREMDKSDEDVLLKKMMRRWRNLMRMMWLSTWALARVRLRDEACAVHILYIWSSMSE